MATALAVAVGVGVWTFLGLRPQASDWVTVQGPHRFPSQTPATLQLHLSEPQDVDLVHLDLHGTDRLGRSLGYLASAQIVRGAGPEAMVLVVLPSQIEARSVSAVIYLSADAGWEGRTRVAVSESIRVWPSMSENLPGRRDWRLSDQPVGPVGAAADAAVAPGERSPKGGEVLPLAALLAASGVCGLCAALGASRIRAERRFWALLAVGAVLIVLWRALSLGFGLTDALREAAELHGLYQLRRPVQRLVLAISAAGSAALLTLLVPIVSRVSPALTVAAAGFVLLILSEGIGVVSIHALDVLSVAGVRLVALLETGAGMTVIVAASICLLKSRSRSS